MTVSDLVGEAVAGASLVLAEDDPGWVLYTARPWRCTPCFAQALTDAVCMGPVLHAILREDRPGWRQPPKGRV